MKLRKIWLFCWGFVVVFGLFSCQSYLSPVNVGDKKTDAKTAHVTFSCNVDGKNSAMRAIIPNVDWNMYTYSIQGIKDGGEVQTLLSGVSSNALSINVELGSWTFTVTAHNNNIEVLSGSTYAIIGSEENNLEIKMKPVAGGNGSATVILKFPSGKGVSRVSGAIYNSAIATDTGTNIPFSVDGDQCRAEFTEDNIPAAVAHFVKFFLYNENDECIGSYIDSLYIVSGLNSSIEKEITEINMFAVSVNIKKDDIEWGESQKLIALQKNSIPYILVANEWTNTYTGSVPGGTYNVFSDGENTNVSLTVRLDGTANASLDFYTVKFSEIPNCTISSDYKNPVFAGRDFSFEINADDQFICGLPTVLVRGEVIADTAGTYTIQNITESTEVTITAVEHEWTETENNVEGITYICNVCGKTKFVPAEGNTENVTTSTIWTGSETFTEWGDCIIIDSSEFSKCDVSGNFTLKGTSIGEDSVAQFLYPSDEGWLLLEVTSTLDDSEWNTIPFNEEVTFNLSESALSLVKTYGMIIQGINITITELSYTGITTGGDNPPEGEISTSTIWTGSETLTQWGNCIIINPSEFKKCDVSGSFTLKGSSIGEDSVVQFLYPDVDSWALLDIGYQLGDPLYMTVSFNGELTFNLPDSDLSLVKAYGMIIQGINVELTDLTYTGITVSDGTDDSPENNIDLSSAFLLWNGYNTLTEWSDCVYIGSYLFSFIDQSGTLVLKGLEIGESPVVKFYYPGEDEWKLLEVSVNLGDPEWNSIPFNGELVFNLSESDLSFIRENGLVIQGMNVLLTDLFYSGTIINVGEDYTGGGDSSGDNSGNPDGKIWIGPKDFADDWADYITIDSSAFSNCDSNNSFILKGSPTAENAIVQFFYIDNEWTYLDINATIGDPDWMTIIFTEDLTFTLSESDLSAVKANGMVIQGLNISLTELEYNGSTESENPEEGNQGEDNPEEGGPSGGEGDTGNTGNENVISHFHVIDTTWKKDSVYHWHEASCGVEEHNADIQEHEWNEEITLEPTEETDGEKTHTCIVCGYEIKENIPAVGHEHEINEEKWENNDLLHWHEASCGIEEHDTDIGVHVWNEEIKTEPTEETPGEKTLTCSICGFTKTETIPITEHSHTISKEWKTNSTNHWHEASCGISDHNENNGEHDWKEETTTEATENTDGEKKFTCKVCGLTKIEKIPATGHHHTKGKLTWDAKYHWFEMSCGLPEHLYKFEHEFDDGVITEKPTTETEGEKIYTCEDCGYEKPVKLKKHVHTYAEKWSKDSTYHWHNFTCSHTNVAGTYTVEKVRHDWDDGRITKKPTTTEKGETTYTCKTCKEQKTLKNIPKHEHTYSTEWSKSDTHHWHKATCDHTKEKKSYTEHKWKVVSETAAEVGKQGIRNFECSVCKKTKKEPIPAIAPLKKPAFVSGLKTNPSLKLENGETIQFLVDKTYCDSRAEKFELRRATSKNGPYEPVSVVQGSITNNTYFHDPKLNIYKANQSFYYKIVAIRGKEEAYSTKAWHLTIKDKTYFDLSVDGHYFKNNTVTYTSGISFRNNGKPFLQESYDFTKKKYVGSGYISSGTYEIISLGGDTPGIRYGNSTAYKLSPMIYYTFYEDDHTIEKSLLADCVKLE